MSNLITNTSIKLNIHAPKKDAVVDAPGTAAGANELRIWVPADVDEKLTQSLVGDFTKMFRYAKTILKDLDGVANPDVLQITSGGSDNDIVVNGTPTTSTLVLEIGTYTGAGDRSHFLDRTFKRMIERLLEESK